MLKDFHMSPWSSPFTSDPLRISEKNKRQVGFSPSKPFLSVREPTSSKFGVSFFNEQNRKWCKKLELMVFSPTSQRLCAQLSHQHQHSTTPDSSKMPHEIPAQTSLVLKEDREIHTSTLSLPLILSAHGPRVRTSIWMENNN